MKSIILLILSTLTLFSILTFLFKLGIDNHKIYQKENSLHNLRSLYTYYYTTTTSTSTTTKTRIYT